MTKQVQRRRGTATQHTSFTGAEGELSVNTTNKSVHVHDGVTTGGIEAARADMTNVSDADLNARLTGNTLSALTITSADINGGTIDGTVIGGASAAAVTATALTATSSATLQHSASTKLATTSTGVDVTGTVTADGLTVDGATSIQNTASTSVTLNFTNSVSGTGNIVYDQGTMEFYTTGDKYMSISGGGDISFYEDTGTTAKLFWDASAEALGIGTTTPEEALDLGGSGWLKVGRGAGYDGGIFFRYSSASASSRNWSLRNDVAGYGDFAISQSNTQNGDVTTSGTSTVRMLINASGNVGIGTSTVTPYTNLVTTGIGGSQGGVLDFHASAVGTGFNRVAQIYGGNGGFLSFGTGASDSITERLRIDASGNVGIGTSSPSAKLEVSGPAASGYGQFVIKSDTTPQMTWYQNTTLEANAYADGTKMVLGSVTSTPLVLRTGGSERMRIDASGNVGIGKSTPTQKLDVAGNVFISGGNTRKFYRAENMAFSTTTTRVDFAFIGNPSPDPSVYGGTTHAHEIYLEGDNQGYDLVFGRKTRSTSGGAGPDYETMRLASSGNLLVGTTSTNLASGALYLAPGTNAELGIGHASAASSGSTFVAFRHNNTGIGSITQSGTTGVSYNTSSDYRLKEDVQPITGASDRVLALKPVNFAWKADGTRVDGFLAHEAQEVVPEAVHGVKDGMRTEEYEVTPAVLDADGNVVTEAIMGTREVPDYQGIDQSKLVPLLTAALQEALKRIEALEAQLNP